MGSTAGMIKARKMWSGWLNSAANPEYEAGVTLGRNPDPLPRVEGIITVHNYVEVLARSNGSTLIRIFDYKQAPPDYKKVNPKTNPELFDFFHSVNMAGEVGNAPEGERFYFPRLAADGIGWLPDDILEYNVDLPTQEKAMGLPSNWAYGLDISKYDETFDRSLSSHVIDFIIQRVSYAGTLGSKQDEKLNELYPNVAEVKRRLAYHYFSGYRSINEQFDTFMGAISGKDFHAFAVDFETMYNPQTAQSAKDAKTLMTKIAQATGKRVLLYQQRHEWAKFSQYWQGVDLWPKYWPYKTFISGFDANATVERYWGHTGPYILQYGGDAIGVYGYGQANEWGVGFGTNRKHVDLDLFNGTPEELDTWLGISNPPDIPVPPDDDTYRQGSLDMAMQNKEDIDKRIEELG